MKFKAFSLFVYLFLVNFANSQSDNCITATPITFVGGSACVNGTSANATSSNTGYAGLHLWARISYNGNGATFDLHCVS